MTNPKGRQMPAVASNSAKVGGIVDISHQDLGGGMGIYRAFQKGTKKEIGWIRYMVPLYDTTVVKILGTYVDPEWRGKKIGTALGERVHIDFPNHFLDLGDKGEAPEAAGFWDYQKQAQPDWGTTVSNDGAKQRVERMRKNG